MKVLTAHCRKCNKPVYSLYEGQLTHNLEQHEKNCSFKTKTSRDSSGSETPADSSHSK